MTVAKSPIMPIFSKSALERSAEANQRTVSSPLAKADDLPSTPEKPKSSGGRSIGSRSFGSRSASTALPQLPQWPPMPDHGNAPLAKKGPLSTGISSRIKALEVFSRRESGSTSPETPKAKPSVLSAIKKRTSQAQGKNAPNTSTALPPPRQLPTPESTPPAEQPVPRPWLQRNGSDTQVGAPMQQGESVSVTARIIRNPEEKLANGVPDTAEPSVMPLQHSVLTVEHARAEPSATTTDGIEGSFCSASRFSTYKSKRGEAKIFVLLEPFQSHINATPAYLWFNGQSHVPVEQPEQGFLWKSVSFIKRGMAGERRQAERVTHKSSLEAYV